MEEERKTMLVRKLDAWTAQAKENSNSTATTKIYDDSDIKVREELHDSFFQAMKDLEKRGFEKVVL